MQLFREGYLGLVLKWTLLILIDIWNWRNTWHWLNLKSDMNGLPVAILVCP